MSYSNFKINDCNDGNVNINIVVTFNFKNMYHIPSIDCAPWYISINHVGSGNEMIHDNKIKKLKVLGICLGAIGILPHKTNIG